jgi:transposase-like protein
MMRKKSSAQKTIRDIRRATRRHYSAEGKIRIVLEGLRGEDTIAELCRREGLNSNVYYRWSKEFLEAGKKRLAGNTFREATSSEVKELRAESSALKETLGELSDYLEAKGMTHTRGRPYHPQTQGKIERWHRSMKNKILLNKYYFPSELQEQLQRFVNYYNHERYHESLDNLTPADVYYGRGQEILEQRENIKLNTLAMRRQLHYDRQSKLVTQMS